MIKFYTTLLFFLCCSLNQVFYAQNQQLVFDRISKEQGLIPGNVNDIVQDSTGFIWMATENGLCRYDGYNFVYYKNEVNDPNSLSYNHVFSLLLDKDGVMWVGTLGGGLNKFDVRTGKFKRFTHDHDNSKTISSDIIYEVFRDSRNRMWISTLGGGLNLFDPVKETFTHFIHTDNNPNTISSNMVSAIYEDRSRRLWFGTFDGGINLYNESENKFVHFKNNPSDKFSLSHNQVMDFIEDDEGRFWVATFGAGVNLFDRDNNKFYNTKNDRDFPIRPDHQNIRILFQDKESIWVGTYSGLFRFDKKTFVKTDIYSNPNNPKSINDNKIRSIFKDKTGVVWVGTIAGVNKYDSMQKKFQLVKFSENYKALLDNQKEIPSRYITKQVIWAGPGETVISKTNNRRIKYFSEKNNGKQLHTQRTVNFYLDEKNYLWVGSYGGIHYYDIKKNEFYNVQYLDDGTEAKGNNFVKWFYFDKKNRFWASTLVGGFLIYDPASNQIKRYAHNENDIKTLGDSRMVSVFEDSYGIVWVATYGGLDIFNEKDGTFKHYRVIPNDSTCIANDRIYDIYESKSRELWIGTYQGLSKYNRETDNFESFTTEDGLGDNTIYSIQEDDQGYLWIRTNDGLSKFDPIRKIFNNYNAKDGLMGMELNGNIHFKNSDGKMFIGSSNGLINFYPNEIIDNPYKPKVVFTKLSILDQEVKVGDNSPLIKPINEMDEVVLSYKDKVISFEFAALHYAIPSKNKYAYKLEGFVDQWVFVDANNRHAKFTNLNPGEYTLKVIASNNDGIWSDVESSIRIIITPPYWETWWFRLIILLVVLSIIFIFYEIRLNRLIEIERTRSRIARNLHDEIGGTLSSIQYFVRALEHDKEKKKVESKSKYLNLILESSADAQEKIKDLIWTVNPDEDGLGKFFIKFNRYASDLLDAKEINYNIKLPVDSVNQTISMEKRQHLWCICKEVLTNIARHSQCKNVFIKIEFSGKRLELYFEDDGIGFEESVKRFSNGLVNIKNRAEALGASYNLITGKDQGTKWTFLISI
jgi:ligand-binding sensor domain-containing protein